MQFAYHACHACQRDLRVRVLTCQKRANFSFLRANMPINVTTSERRANFSTWCANFLPPPDKRRANFSTIFQKNRKMVQKMTFKHFVVKTFST